MNIHFDNGFSTVRPPKTKNLHFAKPQQKVNLLQNKHITTHT